MVDTDRLKEAYAELSKLLGVDLSRYERVRLSNTALSDVAYHAVVETELLELVRTVVSTYKEMLTDKAKRVRAEVGNGYVEVEEGSAVISLNRSTVNIDTVLHLVHITAYNPATGGLKTLMIKIIAETREAIIDAPHTEGMSREDIDRVDFSGMKTMFENIHSYIKSNKELIDSKIIGKFEYIDSVLALTAADPTVELYRTGEKILTLSWDEMTVKDVVRVVSMPGTYKVELKILNDPVREAVEVIDEAADVVISAVNTLRASANILMKVIARANDLNIKLPPTFSIYFDYIRISTVNLLTGEVSVTYRDNLILKHVIYNNIMYVYMTDYKWWKDDLPGKIRDFMENKLEPNIDKFITILMLYP